MKKMLVWFFVTVLFLFCGIVFALVSIGGGEKVYSVFGIVFSSLGLISVMVMSMVANYMPRKLRSGSPQYQKLKRTTFAQLKTNIDDAERIKQVFYLDAENCGVMKNIAEKDFQMMLEALE